MRKKPNIKSDINAAAQAIKELMQENLSQIATVMIDTIVSRVANSTDSQRFNAIKDVPKTGIAEYKTRLLDALAVISSEALDQARKEVPKAKNVRLAGESEPSIQLGEFERLPADMRKKILMQSQLLLDTQIADLEKAVYFQFGSSIDSTDSLDLLRADLNEAAEDYISGASITSGSGATAASIVNSARNSFFLDDDVQSQIDAFVFTNGDPVSAICQDLSGTVFSADDPNLNRYWPPLHWNCKSYILPILKGNLGPREITKLNPSKKAQESIQFSECTCGCRDKNNAIGQTE